MLGVEEFFANTWQAAASSGTGGTTPSVLQSTTANLAQTNFGPTRGVTTTGVVNGISPPLPVLVMADYSLWCPVLGVFVRPEDTNFLQKVEG